MRPPWTRRVPCFSSEVLRRGTQPPHPSCCFPPKGAEGRGRAVGHWRRCLRVPESRCCGEGGVQGLAAGGWAACAGPPLDFLPSLTGHFVWRGATGPAEPINTSWPEIQGPLDAAVRIRQAEQPTIHNSLYLFQVLWGLAVGEGHCCPPQHPQLLVG